MFTVERIKTFIGDSDGAVTVDWVVLSAGVIGLGVAATTAIESGLTTATGNVAAALADDGSFTPVTAGLVNPIDYSAGSSRLYAFRWASELSFQTEMEFSSEDEGILFEFGGAGIGSILYQHDGVLYLQAGAASGTGEGPGRGEAAWTVEDGPAVIEGVMDASQGLTLYVNGEAVDTSEFQASMLIGSDAGAVGEGYNSIPVNRGGFVRTDGHPSVDTIQFFQNQTPDDYSAAS